MWQWKHRWKKNGQVRFYQAKEFLMVEEVIRRQKASHTMEDEMYSFVQWRASLQNVKGLKILNRKQQKNVKMDRRPEHIFLQKRKEKNCVRASST